jgi:hypothetical protein
MPQCCDCNEVPMKHRQRSLRNHRMTFRRTVAMKHSIQPWFIFGKDDACRTKRPVFWLMRLGRIQCNNAQFH